MMPIKNLDPQLIAAKAGKTAPQGANQLVGEAPAMSGDFAAMLMQEVGEAQANSEVAPGLTGEMLNLQAVEVPSEALAHGLNPQAGVNAQPVPLNQLNWAMEGMPQALPMGTEPTPKLLDPTLIQQVNEVVLPPSAEQVNAQPIQLKDLLMNQQGLGRSPAIDLAQAEIDPQLMGFEDFVAHKNAVKGKAIQTNAYGMPMKNVQLATEAQKAQNVKDLQWSVEAVPSFQTGPTAAQLSQPLYSMEAPMAPNRVETSAPRVFDMNQLAKVDTTNTDQVISQISDYIVQAKASKEPTVNMRVQHQDLGMLDITVNRAHNDVMTIAIGTQDQGAKMFLGQHREQLLTHLSQAGVTVGDLKMEQSSSSNQRDMGQSSQQGSHPQDRQFGSEQNQRRHEQERRQELWSMMQEKEVA